jgi:hypothetical protein
MADTTIMAAMEQPQGGLTMIHIKCVKSHRMEVWQIFYNDTYITEFMSREYAISKARQLCHKLFQGVK